MASPGLPELPDFDELALRLVRLRRSEQDLARRLEKAEERAAQFPSEHALRERDSMRAQDANLHSEIALLEEQLRPVLRRPEPT